MLREVHTADAPATIDQEWLGCDLVEQVQPFIVAAFAITLAEWIQEIKPGKQDCEFSICCAAHPLVLFLRGPQQRALHCS
jgi:hypothetical protein